MKNLFDTRYIAPNGTWSQGTATAPASYTIQAQPRYFGLTFRAQLDGETFTGSKGGAMDLPNTKSPSAAPWTGIYAGLNVGYGWGEPYGLNGVIGGGQVGYIYQFSPLFVAGAEADIEGTGLSTYGHGPVRNRAARSTMTSRLGRAWASRLSIPDCSSTARQASRTRKCATTARASTSTGPAGSPAAAWNGL